ncbi:MAG TPA: hypothetical protein VIZ65_16170 [Cellvibrionaceae bacterium]
MLVEDELLDELLLLEELLLVLPDEDELLLDELLLLEELLLVLPVEDELLLDELLEDDDPGPLQAASIALNIPIISILRIIDKAPRMTTPPAAYMTRLTTKVGRFR